jgi:mono/diheme cytochrome c family protein
MRTLFQVALFLALTCACAPQQAPVARMSDEAARGMVYAEERCAACHAVAPGEMISPNPGARSFQAVANTPGMTALALRVWLQSPHRTMPDVIVPPERMDDLAAYLDALRDR